MLRLALTLTVGCARVLLRSRLELMVENLALRQQLAVFKQKHPRPRLGPTDRMSENFLIGAILPFAVRTMDVFACFR